MSMKPKFAKSNRPKDKFAINQSATNQGTTQTSSPFRTASVAETFTGGVIIGSVTRGSATGTGFLVLLCILLRDGVSTPVVTLTTGASLLKPEADILWARIFQFTGSANQDHGFIFVDKIKTKRKLQEGDRIQFIADASIANLANYAATLSGFVLQ